MITGLYIHCSGTELLVYDTVYSDIDDSTMALIQSTFKEDITHVAVAKIQKQHGDVDCGVFSVAIATSLLHGLSPGPYTTSTSYNQLF